MNPIFLSNNYVFEKVPGTGNYEAQVPTLESGQYMTRSFSGDNAKKRAKQWRDEHGIEIWGARRWMFIISNAISIRTMRSDTNGVFVSESESYSKPNMQGEIFGYPHVRIDWREEGVGQCRTFFYSQYESKEETELEASLFVARLKASLTGGELNLPFTRESFDLSSNHIRTS